MTVEPRKAIFAAVKDVAPGVWNDAGRIRAMDDLLDSFGVPRTSERREINKAGLELIKSFEGMVLKAYPDPGSGGDPWTIGYGHTGPDVYKGLVITEAQADELLRADLRKFEDAVFRLVGWHATDNQFSALVSFAFNVGAGEGGLKTSTLLRKHNAGDYAGARAEFARWNRAANKVMAGLTRRRAAEANLYGAA